MSRLTIKALQTNIGADPDGNFGNLSKAALFAKLSNKNAAPITKADIQQVADSLGAPFAILHAVRKIEAPRGAFDDNGRPSILYERHVFKRNCAPPGAFDKSNPDISGPRYGAGGYGPYGVQYDRLAAACALDPEAAFRAVSWGAFQVLGENAEAMGYKSAWDMALSLTKSEAAHLDCFARFVRANQLQDELKACRPGDANSCIPFVERYNGPGFREFNYHIKLAQAALTA